MDAFSDHTEAVGRGPLSSVAIDVLSSLFSAPRWEEGQTGAVALSTAWDGGEGPTEEPPSSIFSWVSPPYAPAPAAIPPESAPGSMRELVRRYPVVTGRHPSQVVLSFLTPTDLARCSLSCGGGDPLRFLEGLDRASSAAGRSVARHSDVGLRRADIAAFSARARAWSNDVRLAGARRHAVAVLLSSGELEMALEFLGVVSSAHPSGASAGFFAPWGLPMGSEPDEVYSWVLHHARRDQNVRAAMAVLENAARCGSRLSSSLLSGVVHVLNANPRRLEAYLPAVLHEMGRAGTVMTHEMAAALTCAEISVQCLHNRNRKLPHTPSFASSISSTPHPLPFIPQLDAAAAPWLDLVFAQAQAGKFSF